MSRVYGPDMLNRYLELTELQESPLAFHKWVFISCVQQMLGRRCWIDQGLYTCFPNEYILLCGGSGKVKKDTAIDIGVPLLEKCPNPPRMFKGGMSGSMLLGILNRLSKKKDPNGEPLDATISLIADEFAAFLGRHPLNEDMVNYLTALYKSPTEWPYATRKHGYEELRNVCINLLCGSTLSWLRECLAMSAISGGFMGRIVTVYRKEGRRRMTKLEKPKKAAEIESNLRMDFSEIGCLEGEFEVTTEAWEFLDDWYKNLDYYDDDPLGPFYERKLDHILKAAMALSASKNDELIITLEDAKEAKKELDDLSSGMKTVCHSVAMSDHGTLVQKVFNRLKTRTIKEGRMSRTDLTRGMAKYMKTPKLDEILEQLCPEVVQVIKEGRGTYYRVRKFYWESDPFTD